MNVLNKIDSNKISRYFLLLICCGILNNCFFSKNQKNEGEYYPAGTRGGPMVFIPSGIFIMGDNSGINGVSKQIYVSDFYIDKYEVTNSEYLECVKEKTCDEVHAGINCDKDVVGLGDFPAVCLSWYQAKNYCEFVGKRLPTEAEWEKAARGTDGRTYPWGNNEPTCDLAAFYAIDAVDSCSEPCTQKVGSRPKGKSPYGAMDMAGNVAEWVDGVVENNSGINCQNDSGECKQVVIRGVPWYYDKQDIGVYAQWTANPDNISMKTGFRCAKSK